MQRVIGSDNFSQILEEIQTSTDKLFDFSNTNFRQISTRQLTALFAALSALPQQFTLKLNNCKFAEENEQHITALTLGLSTTQNMRALEFKRSTSADCREEILLALARSLVRNHQLNTITLDGFKVTPPTVAAILKSHPTATTIFIDGLARNMRPGFFNKAAANSPVTPEADMGVTAQWEAKWGQKK